MIAGGLHVTLDDVSRAHQQVASSRDLLRLEQCIGEGYAKSTRAELEFVAETVRPMHKPETPPTLQGLIKTCHAHRHGPLGFAWIQCTVARVRSAWQST